MKILKIYSNNPWFHNVTFNKTWLNVIIWKISNRDDYSKDTHNLWKSLLGKIINFLLLQKINKKEEFFLTKNPKFSWWEFYIELLLNNWKILIIKRNVDNNTKIFIKESNIELESYDLSIKDWSYNSLSIDKAKVKLNEYLSFDILKEYNYRKYLDYFIRSQEDFLDVFKLNKFKWKDRDWKPMILELLNFESNIYIDKIKLDEKQEEIESKITFLRKEHKVDENKIDEINWIIDIETEKKNEIEKNIDSFNFSKNYKNDKTKIVDELDVKIESLNSYHYNIKTEIKRCENSLDDNIDTIDLNRLKTLLNEIDIIFPNKLINQYEDVIDFNKQITLERIAIIKENLEKLKKESDDIEKEINSLEEEKWKILTILTDKDSYEKFKYYQKELSKKEADLIYLNKKIEIIDEINWYLRDKKDIETSIARNIENIHNLILTQKHKEIRRIFWKIIEDVLNTSAIISLKQNWNWNIDFIANYKNPENMIDTDEWRWNSYRKILCSAFDLSITFFYSQYSFYKFIYHDWILDDLDIRKVEKYIETIRTLTNKYNIQYILTIIDSKLSDEYRKVSLNENEIRLILSDENEKWALFWFKF